MALKRLEEIAASRGLPHEEASAMSAAAGVKLSVALDQLSYDIAKRYLSGTVSFTYADSVMNGLHLAILMDPSGIESEFAWEVFLAFVAGEYRHAGDSEEVDSEEKFTKPLLLEALKNRNEK